MVNIDTEALALDIASKVEEIISSTLAGRAVQRQARVQVMAKEVIDIALSNPAALPAEGKGESEAEPAAWLLEWGFKDDPDFNLAGGGSKLTRDEDEVAKHTDQLRAYEGTEWIKSTPLFTTPPNPQPLERAVKARAGEAYLEDGDDHTTYDIDVAYTDFLGKEQWWGGQIKVFGDEKLRDHILSYLSPAPQPVGEIREGWKLVPVEPTDGMIEQAEDALAERIGLGMRIYASDVWRDMLSASPSPAAKEEEKVPEVTSPAKEL